MMTKEKLIKYALLLAKNFLCTQKKHVHANLGIRVSVAPTKDLLTSFFISRKIANNPPAQPHLNLKHINCCPHYRKKTLF
jgi:hypothetical protein